MCTKRVVSYWKDTLVLASFGGLVVVTTVLITRGLHGRYELGLNGLYISLIGSLPFIVLYLIYARRPKQLKRGSIALALILSICLVLYYLVRNGLWCAQHTSVTRALCEKLAQFALFARLSNVTSWWLTLGDLLAIQRGLAMPMAWEHDIDICISRGQYPIFEQALKARSGYFDPEPELQHPGHWYLPIDMTKLGLRARDAEGVIVDVWSCPQLSGNITQVPFCNAMMNIPGSPAEIHRILSKNYGDYSLVEYEHHSPMCKIWNSW